MFSINEKLALLTEKLNKLLFYYMVQALIIGFVLWYFGFYVFIIVALFVCFDYKIISSKKRKYDQGLFNKENFTLLMLNIMKHYSIQDKNSPIYSYQKKYIENSILKIEKILNKDCVDKNILLEGFESQPLGEIKHLFDKLEKFKLKTKIESTVLNCCLHLVWTSSHETKSNLNELLNSIVNHINPDKDELNRILSSELYKYGFDGQYFNYEFYAPNDSKYTSEIMQAAKLLGISPNADKVAIQKAYRTMIAKYHPDKLSSLNLGLNDHEKAKELAASINNARDILLQNLN